MNKKSVFKAVAPSVAALLMSAGVAAGATYALFTSSDKATIDITSGTVQVALSFKDLALYTPTSVSMDCTVIDDTNAATMNPDGKSGKFGFGGSASLVGNSLTFDKMKPGDKVTVTAVVTNTSNVTVKYRTIIKAIEDSGLFSGLVITVGGETFSGNKTMDWKTEAAPNVEEIPITIEMPLERGNEYQNKTCKIEISLEAVQANAATQDGFASLAVINAALAASAQVNEYPYAAVKEVEGFVNASLPESLEGYTIGWNRKTDQFVLLDDSLSTGKDIGLYMFVDDVAKWPGYSHYINATLADDVKNITTNRGLDVGANTGLETVNYINNGADAVEQDVLVRTNTLATLLTVDAPLDTVTHYGFSAIVDVIRTAGHSYVEQGVVGREIVREGHAVAGDNSEVFCLMEGENAQVEVDEDARVYDGNIEVDHPHVEEIHDCGAGNHEFSKFVVDSQHVYDICKKCGYTLINVRVTDEITSAVTEVKQTKNTVVEDPITHEPEIVENVAPVETYKTTITEPEEPVSPEGKKNYEINVTDPVVPTPEVDPASDPEESARCDHDFEFVSEGYNGHKATCSDCGFIYHEAHDSTDIVEIACSKCGYKHTHSYATQTHRLTSGYEVYSYDNCPDCGKRISDEEAVSLKGAKAAVDFGPISYYSTDVSPLTDCSVWATQSEETIKGKTQAVVKPLIDLIGDDAVCAMNQAGPWTFDLNGKVVSKSVGDDTMGDYGGANNGILWFQGDSNYANVTLKDSSTSGDGIVENTCADKKIATAVVIAPRAASTVTFESGTYKAVKDAFYMEKGTATINGGTFIGENAVHAYAYNGLGASLTTLTINDGLFNGNIKLHNEAQLITQAYQKVSATINGGTFNGLLNIGENVDLVISGGKFTDPRANNYLADGKILVEEEDYFVVKDAGQAPESANVITNGKLYYVYSDGDYALEKAVSGDVIALFVNATYVKVLGEGEEITILPGTGVTYAEPVAAAGFTLKTEAVEGGTRYYVPELPPVEVDGVGYATLQEAFDNCAAKTIKLNKNIELTATVKLNKLSRQHATFDLNGKTITYTGTNKMSGGLIYIENSSSKTSPNLSIFTIKDSVGGAKVICNASLGCALKYRSGTGTAGALVINGGTFEGTRYGLDCEWGPVTINGGTFIGGTEGCYINTWGLDATYHYITLNGGTYSNNVGSYVNGTTIKYGSGKTCVQDGKYWVVKASA